MDVLYNAPAIHHPMPMTSQIHFTGLSHIGQVRSTNQDAFGIYPDLNLFLVADGMGGHAGGGVASRMAVESVRDDLRQKEPDGNSRPYPERLRQAMEQANRKIYNAGMHDPDLTGMGTTLVSAFVEGAMIHIGNVGDSRAYRIRGNEIRQITTDHSWINDQLARGQTPSPDETERYKHMLTRALGPESEIQADILSQPLDPGDILLLCSDGLTNTLSDQDMEQCVNGFPDKLQRACERLIQLANDQGGPDNITVVLIQYTDHGGGPAG